MSLGENGSVDVGGVLIPVTTPFRPGEGDLDRAALAANVRRWSGTGVHGLVVGGSTGEAVLLDEDERLAAFETVRDAASDDLTLVAGTGAESLRATIRMTSRAASLGYDAVLVQPPAFYRGAMKPGVVRDHYLAVAERSEVPVVVYQAPTRFSTLDLPTGLIAELSAHENVVGVKDSRGKLELVGDLLTQTTAGFQVLVGSGAILYAALELGASGGILGVANLAPAQCASIFELFRAGDARAAGRIQEGIGRLHDAVVGGMGVAGVKRGLDLLGFGGGLPRPPLPPLPAQASGEIAARLRDAGVRIPDGPVAA